MSVYAFTGPSRLSLAQDQQARQILRAIRLDNPLATWRSGGAYGLDTLVVEESGCTQNLILVVPYGRTYNEQLLADFDLTDTWHIEGGYRERNEHLVEGVDKLHAFVRQPMFYRSGEWMTINIAKHRGVPVEMHVLEGALNAG